MNDKAAMLDTFTLIDFKLETNILLRQGNLQESTVSQEIDILSRITTDVSALRDAEKKVAELIFADIDFVTEASIGEIAQRAGVSDASVTRFARAVGCTNVRDLKTRLNRALAAGRRFIQEATPDDSSSVVYDIAMQTLAFNRDLLAQADIPGAVEQLDKARQILVFGAGGGSSILSQELQFRLSAPWLCSVRLSSSAVASHGGIDA